MSAPDRLSLLIAEVGPLLDGEHFEYLEITENAEGDTWSFLIEDDLALRLEADADSGLATLSVPLVPLHPDHELALCRTFLHYNAQWRETGGLKIALAEDERVTLAFAFDPSACDARALAHLIGRFVEAALSWLLLLATPDKLFAQDAPALPPGSLGSFGSHYTVV